MKWTVNWNTIETPVRIYMYDGRNGFEVQYKDKNGSTRTLLYVRGNEVTLSPGGMHDAGLHKANGSA